MMQWTLGQDIALLLWRVKRMPERVNEFETGLVRV
jgi:hypothetical protein